MSSYNPPSENLPTFNPAVFSDNFTPDQVDSKIKTLETEMDTQQLKTTKLTYNTSDDNSKFGSQLVIQDTGDNTAGENDLNHQLRLITGSNDETLMLGYDNSVDIAYINSAKSGSVQPVCLQTRGGNVGIGLTNPSELLDVNGTGKFTNLKTANHTDVDGSLTSINTKLTGISYSAGNDETDIDTNSGNFKLSVQNQGVKLEGDPASTDIDVIPLQGQSKGGSIQIRMLNRLGTGDSQNYHLYTNNFQRDSTNGFNIINDSYKAQKLELLQPAIGDAVASSVACIWAFYSSTSDNPSTSGEIKFYYDGDIEANNVSHTSDKRLKENIVDAKTDNLISDFQKIRFVNYNYIGKDRKELGVIGQELKEIYPSLVVERNNPKEDKTEDDLDSYLSVKYGVINIKGLMVVQELIKKVESLEQRIKELEK